MQAQHEAWLAEGITLFNEGAHWHAHEAWEHLWLELHGEDKRFVQGLIMAAAMLVQHGKRIQRGVENHYRNATDRLAPHAPKKWGIDVDGLIAQLGPFVEDEGLDGREVQILRR